MNNFEYKILLVDDEEDIIEFIKYNLKREGFIVYTATNGKKGIEMAQEIKPHLVILDVMMPEMDGIEICEKMRKIPQLNNTLIAFLTARAEDYSQIAGFSAGADDYIKKPIKPKVLISRIKALLKRYGKVGGTATSVNNYSVDLGSITIDTEKYIVIKDNVEMTFPRKEFNLLLLLTSKPSKVFTREEIFNHLWGSDIYVEDRTIDVYIRKIREKIGVNNIKTIKGVGYKYEVN